MAYVITQGCCNDGSCVPVCPVQCIRPRPGDPDFTHTEQLYIDPATCIDCGACMDECPVDAIYPDFEIPEALTAYADINADYFTTRPISGASVPSYTRRVLADGHEGLRVAIVGSGPAGCYAAGVLSEITGVTVSVFDRLPTPFGLVRAGVAPDHPHTKGMADHLGKYLDRPGVTCYFNVEIGKDISLEELLDHHHAVIWAGGARSERTLDIPGESLSGVYSARDFVAWYNGHPEFADRQYSLNGPRAVVVGNGNVALDVARTLLLPADVLSATDMPDAAIDALSRSEISEVVVVGRRGPEHAAYSLGELLALAGHDLVTLAAEKDEIEAAPDHGRRHDVLLRAASGEADSAGRLVRLRFGLTPVSIEGNDAVRSITCRTSDGTLETIETTTVFRAIGYRGLEVAGFPFDATTGTIPHDAGRVIAPESDEAIPGLYCAGWIKRGPRGVIGTNKTDAEETVDSILDDLANDRLTPPRQGRDSLDALLASRGVEVVDSAGWKRIDAAERAAGREHRRPREKFISIAELLESSRSTI